MGEPSTCVNYSERTQSSLKCQLYTLYCIQIVIAFTLCGQTYVDSPVYIQ